MKTSTLALALAGHVAGFSTLRMDNVLAARDRPQEQDGGAFLPLANPPFDAKAQYVSTTGEHAWQAPGPNDSRGVCPGLNALANHNYIPRNGFATITQFIEGTYAGVGMERDLGGFLSILGAVVDGNGEGWLIGGTVRTGIGGSHHNYECDSSPFKPDLNQYGSNTDFIMSQFKNLYFRQPADGTANYDLGVLRDFRGSRFNESIHKNPWFFYGPFDGVAVSQAAHTFIYRFMSNKSAEHPEGILDRETLKSWHSVSGPDDNLVHTVGHERIPDNFYKRHPLDSYSIPYFITDIAFFALKYPEIFGIGCNTGKVNSYAELSLNTILFPFFNNNDNIFYQKKTAQSMFCLGMGSQLLNIPNLVASVASKDKLKSTIQNIMTSQKCPALSGLNFPVIGALCPGFSLYGGPNGPVAPGAIQTP